MDPVTHALSGALIKNLGFKRRAALGVLVFSAMAPDLDFLTRFWGADVMLRHHGGVTHGIFALLLVPLMVGLIFRKNFFYYWAIAFLGYGLHIALDVLGSRGIRLFAPFDWQPYSANLTFVLDPYVAGGLLLSFALARMKKERARLIAATTMLLLVSYVGARYYLHERAEEFLRASLDEYVVETVNPMPNDFLRWWFIARSDREIKTGYADLFTGAVYFHKTYARDNHDPLIEQSKKSRGVRNFLFFAKYPYAEVRKKGGVNVVKWIDLAFAHMPGERFTATVRMGDDGKLISSTVRI